MAMSDDELTVHDFMPEQTETQEFMVSAGTALSTGASIAARDDVIEALRTVFDPEIPVNIYDLGLVYLCELDKSGGVTVEMTLTAPGCGMGPAIAPSFSILILCFRSARRRPGSPKNMPLIHLSGFLKSFAEKPRSSTKVAGGLVPSLSDFNSDPLFLLDSSGFACLIICFIFFMFILVFQSSIIGTSRKRAESSPPIRNSSWKSFPHGRETGGHSPV